MQHPVTVQHHVTVQYGPVIDGHVAARFHLDAGHGRRLIGTLAVPHSLLWVLDHMIESADSAAEFLAALDDVPQPIDYKITR